jgi:DNA polymerase-3 subunit delta'
VLTAVCNLANSRVPLGRRLPAAREDKLEAYLRVLHGLVADLLSIREGSGEVRNPELKAELEKLAARVSFNWIRSTVARVDELVGLLRRNIQKSIALDALILELRAQFDNLPPNHDR